MTGRAGGVVLNSGAPAVMRALLSVQLEAPWLVTRTLRVLLMP
jgi:hypothetical protein